MAEDTEEMEELSMEDILSSIKDILMEDSAEQHKEEAAPVADNVPQSAPEISEPTMDDTVDDVLNLSPSMIVEANMSTTAAQSETETEEGADPLEFDLEQDIGALSAEIAPSNVETEVIEEPMDLSAAIASVDSNIAQSDELSDVVFAEPVVDINAEPIFSAEDEELHQNFDEISLDNLVDDETLGAILNTNSEDVKITEPEELLEPTDNVYGNIITDTVEEAEVAEKEIIGVSAPENIIEVASAPLVDKQIQETDKAEESIANDPIDVSADIISNFAKMFAEQQKKKEPDVTQEELKEQLTAQTMAEIELGDGSLTIEAIVRDVVTGIIEKNLAHDFDFSAVASAEIARQTKEWLNANLAKIVETAVKKEIERVMAKVSS